MPRAYEPELGDHGRSAAGPVQHLVRAVSSLDEPRAGQARHADRLHRPLALRGRDGLRRPLLAADPSDRQTFRKGRNNASDRRARRTGQPLGDRRGRRGPQGDSARAGNAGRFRAAGRGGRAARHGDRAGHRVSVLARPSLCQRASRVVPASARRHDPICREPAEEIPGYLSVRFRVGRLARPVA